MRRRHIAAAKVIDDPEAAGMSGAARSVSATDSIHFMIRTLPTLTGSTPAICSRRRPCSPSSVHEFLGRRPDSAARAVVGLLVSVFLLVYAAGIWRLRGWALPMAWFYAAYVTANLLLFPFRTP